MRAERPKNEISDASASERGRSAAEGENKLDYQDYLETNAHTCEIIEEEAGALMEHLNTTGSLIASERFSAEEQEQINQRYTDVLHILAVALAGTSAGFMSIHANLLKGPGAVGVGFAVAGLALGVVSSARSFLSRRS